MLLMITTLYQVHNNQQQIVQPTNKPSCNHHLLMQITEPCSIVCLTRLLALGRPDKMWMPCLPAWSLRMSSLFISSEHKCVCVCVWCDDRPLQRRTVNSRRQQMSSRHRPHTFQSRQQLYSTMLPLFRCTLLYCKPCLCSVDALCDG